MNKYNGLILSLIAGMSTIIGYFSIYIKGDKNKIISKSLSFAGGVMIMISIIDLIPSSISYLNNENSMLMSVIYSFIFFLIGFILSDFIEKSITKEEGLYKTGVISMIGIILHNIPEGIATYLVSSVDLKLGILLTIAIIMHNIPEGIGIAIPIYYGTNNKIKAFIYTLISGFSETLGALLSFIFLYKFISLNMIGLIYAIIAGLMIYIGYFEMINTSKKYKINVKNFTLLGFLVVLIIEIILKV